MVEKLNRSFVTKDYKAHRQNALLETEISKMPETMDAADRTKRSEYAMSKAKRCAADVKQLQEKIRTLKDEEYVWRNGARRILNGKDEKTEKRKFIMACQAKIVAAFFPLNISVNCVNCRPVLSVLRLLDILKQKSIPV